MGKMSVSVYILFTWFVSMDKRNYFFHSFCLKTCAAGLEVFVNQICKSVFLFIL